MGNASLSASDRRKYSGFYKSGLDKTPTPLSATVPVPFTFKPMTLCIRQVLRLPASQGYDKPRDIVVLRRVHVLAELTTVSCVAPLPVVNDEINQEPDNQDIGGGGGGGSGLVDDALAKAVKDLCRTLGISSNNNQDVEPSYPLLHFYVVRAADAHLNMPVPGAKQVGPLAVVTSATLETWLARSIDI
jgi:hypothetical protein